MQMQIHEVRGEDSFSDGRDFQRFLMSQKVTVNDAMTAS